MKLTDTKKPGSEVVTSNNRVSPERLAELVAESRIRRMTAISSESEREWLDVHHSLIELTERRGALARATFHKHRADPCTWILYLLEDEQISVGKAAEWLREYIHDAKEGSLPDVALSDHETKPARDAEHCDFPDCEQHWTLVVRQLLAQCEAYRCALDTMFARMIERTANDKPRPFFPTESGQPWEACQRGHALIQSVRAALKSDVPKP